jgi:hypothetical protein
MAMRILLIRRASCRIWIGTVAERSNSKILPNRELFAQPEPFDTSTTDRAEPSSNGHVCPVNALQRLAFDPCLPSKIGGTSEDRTHNPELTRRLDQADRVLEGVAIRVQPAYEPDRVALQVGGPRVGS